MNSDSLNMVSRLGEGHMPGTFFLSEPQLKTTVILSAESWFRKQRQFSQFHKTAGWTWIWLRKLVKSRQNKKLWIYQRWQLFLLLMVVTDVSQKTWQIIFQVNNFQKVPFGHLFFENFDRFYYTAVLSCRISVQILW